jgi:DNA topoisomerase VI subunit B
MLFELLKNSLRAVVERFGPDYEDEFPAIKVVIAYGREDITIKISDEGGGIPRSGIPLVWTYMVKNGPAKRGIKQRTHTLFFLIVHYGSSAGIGARIQSIRL